MSARQHLLFRSVILSCILLFVIFGVTGSVLSVPSINISGNDDYYVWGTVQEISFPLHYRILLYVEHPDGKWYGPVMEPNSTMPGLGPDMKWKIRYYSGDQDLTDKAFQVYLIEKGVTLNQVMIQGAGNISLFYTTVAARSEAERR